MHDKLDRRTQSAQSTGTLFVVHRDLRGNEAGLAKLLAHAPENHSVVFNDQSADIVFGRLREADLVVSNSFHALYWATLLRKRAIAIGGGTKVRLLRHSVPLATASTWPGFVTLAQTYPSALEECRDRNSDFSRHVSQSIIGGPWSLPRRHVVQDPVHERKQDFLVSKISLPRSPRGRVPRVVHFVFGLSADFGGKPFNIMHSVAVRSVEAKFKPDEIQFHYRYKPDNEFFSCVEGLLSLKPAILPTEFKGARLEHFAHRADVLRLKVLNSVGGIYLDLDTITVGTFEPLLKHDFTIGLQGRPRTQGLCNAVMAACPGSAFGSAWLERYRNFTPARWDGFSVRLPYLMWRSGKYAVNVEASDRFHWPLWDEGGLRMMYEQDHQFNNAIVHHLWESKASPTYFAIESYDAAVRRLLARPSTYTRLARPYL